MSVLSRLKGSKMDDLILKPADAELVSMLDSWKALSMPMPYERDIYLLAVPVAGTSYKENIGELAEHLSEGDLVTLIREPENPYDEFAIRIDVDLDGVPGIGPGEGDKNNLTRKMGYIPRATNKVFARLMDAGKLLFGVIRSVDMITDDYYRIMVKIYMRD